MSAPASASSKASGTHVYGSMQMASRWGGLYTTHSRNCSSKVNSSVRRLSGSAIVVTARPLANVRSVKTSSSFVSAKRMPAASPRCRGRQLATGGHHILELPIVIRRHRHDAAVGVSLPAQWHAKIRMRPKPEGQGACARVFDPHVARHAWPTSSYATTIRKSLGQCANSFGSSTDAWNSATARVPAVILHPPRPVNDESVNGVADAVARLQRERTAAEAKLVRAVDQRTET